MAHSARQTVPSDESWVQVIVSVAKNEKSADPHLRIGALHKALLEDLLV